MCTIIWAQNVFPDYPFVMMANRDEQFSRPTSPMDWWEDENILAGKDLRGGGTWMGLNKKGEFAAITNFRDGLEEQKDAPTRGLLPIDYLQSKLTAIDFVSQLEHTEKAAKKYNGFNLLLGNMEQLYCYNNRDGGLQKVEDGIHGLSNAFLETNWPKVAAGKQYLETLKKQKEKPSADDLFQFMSNPQTYPDHLLPSTNIPHEWEQALSAMCIKLSDYGTRVTSVLILDKNGNLEISEFSRLENSMVRFSLHL